MSDLIRREDAIEALNKCVDIKGYAYALLHDAIMEHWLCIVNKNKLDHFGGLFYYKKISTFNSKNYNLSTQISLNL